MNSIVNNFKSRLEDVIEKEAMRSQSYEGDQVRVSISMSEEEKDEIDNIIDVLDEYEYYEIDGYSIDITCIL